MQHILKPKDQVVIFVDSRENGNVKNLLEENGGRIKKMNLEVGDYICSDRLCIEKKTADDFVSSIIDGRLFKQLEELKENFEKPVILIEGNDFREGMNENAIKAALSSIIIDYEIPVLMTKDEEDSAKTIYWLSKREQLETKRPVGIKGRKKPKDIKKLQEYIISGFPGVSTTISKRILKEFKTIQKFSNATEEELKKVEGVGDSLAKKLRKLIKERYD